MHNRPLPPSKPRRLPNAPFDKFLRGDANALGANARAGLQLFIDAGCAACHTGVNLGGTMYQKFGIAADPDPQIPPGWTTLTRGADGERGGELLLQGSHLAQHCPDRPLLPHRFRNRTWPVRST